MGPVPYLFLDATFLDARKARKVENVSALAAYGIGLDGHRQLLAVTIGAEKSEESWSELLAQILERGLSGVQLVVADAHVGIAKAVRRHLPEVPQQRCTVHLQRNVLSKAPQRLRGRLAREVSKVFDASSKVEARRRVETFNASLGKKLCRHSYGALEKLPFTSPGPFDSAEERVALLGHGAEEQKNEAPGAEAFASESEGFDESGRQDSNLRPLGPEPSALPG